MGAIPKVIHYCWFGGNEKPELVSECILSWKKYLPDWEIVEWNEDNYDVMKTAYTAEAYNLKKWAFVSDYARFDVLHEFGGVYLDIDVEFIKPLPEAILECEGFCGFEGSRNINPGLIFGAIKGHPLLKRLLDMYAEEHFTNRKDGSYKTVNIYLTEMLMQDGLVKNNSLQKVSGLTIYPSEYFCGYDTDVREPMITERTICWHHYLGSWVKPSVKMKMQNILKKLIGVKNYKRLILLNRKLRKIGQDN